MAQVTNDQKMKYYFTFGNLASDISGVSNISKSSGSVSRTSDRFNEENALKIGTSTRLPGGNTSNFTSNNINNSTLSFWMKQSEITTSQTKRIIQVYGDNSHGFRIELAFNGTDVTLGWNARLGTVSSYTGHSAATIQNDLDNDSWHHIVVRTELTSANKVKFDCFIDGTLNTALSNKTITHTQNISLLLKNATLYLSPTANYDGNLDDVYFYDRNLSDAEISLLYNETAQPANIIYVNHAATGTGDGTSWSNAYTDARTAFISAPNSSQIWMAKGKYIRIGTNRNAVFGWETENISLYGGFSGDGTETSIQDRDWVNNKTILSGDLGNDNDPSNNAYHVFMGPLGNINQPIHYAYINGIIIQDGNANGSGSTKTGRMGAGVLLWSYVTNVKFENCVIQNNTAVGGAGIHASSEGRELYLNMTNCRLTNNTARVGAPFLFHTDGKNLTVDIANCLIDNNTIKDLPMGTGGNGHGGSAISYNGGRMTLIGVNTTWAKNKNTGTTVQTRKPILALSKRWGSGQGYMTLGNCIFSDNERSQNNFTFDADTKNYGFSFIGLSNILMDDTTGYLSHINDNIILENAQFMDLANDDFRIKATSPAKDEGDTSGFNIIPTLDLGGNPRVHGTNIDLGCYESKGSASIRKSASEKITIYPNPTKGMISVKSRTPIKAIKIMNISGQVLFQSSGNTIDVSSLQTGIYILKTDEQNGTRTSRFIKQ